MSLLISVNMPSSDTVPRKFLTILVIWLTTGTAFTSSYSPLNPSITSTLAIGVGTKTV